MVQLIADSGAPDPHSDMLELIKAGGVVEVSASTVTELCKMQQRLQRRIGDASAALTEHKISREKYLAFLNMAFREATRKGEKLIGAEAFHQVFGDLTVDTILDANQFRAVDSD